MSTSSVGSTGSTTSNSSLNSLLDGTSGSGSSTTGSTSTSSAPITFTGLGSGIDWQSIVSELDQAAIAQNITPLQNQITTLQTTGSAWQTLGTNLTSLQTAIQNLDLPSAFNVFQCTASTNSTSIPGSSLLTASADSTAIAGQHTIEINNIATAEKDTTNAISAGNVTSSAGITGSLVINGQSTGNLNNQSLNEIAATINTMDSTSTGSVVPTGVSASIVQTSTGKQETIASSTSTAANTTSAMSGLTGSLKINGTTISSNLGTQSLATIESTINNTANLGVTASITGSTGSYKLVLTNESAGTTQMNLSGSTTSAFGAIGQQEIVQSNVSTAANTTSAMSGLTGSLAINGTTISSDLSTQSLTTIESAINNTANLGVTASITGSTGSYKLVLTNNNVGTTGMNLTGTTSGGAFGTIDGSGNSSNITQAGTNNTDTQAGTNNTYQLVLSADNTGASTIDYNGTTAQIGSSGLLGALTPTGYVPASYATTGNIASSPTTDAGVTGAIVINGQSASTDVTGMSLQDIATAINALDTGGTPTGVTASVSGSGSNYKLLLANDNGAAASTISFTGTTAQTASATTNIFGGALDGTTSQAASANIATNPYQIQAGANASFTVDSIPVTSASNTVSTALPGVTLNLLSQSPGTPINLNIGLDTNSIGTNVQAFVTAYNSVMSFINTQSTYNANTQTTGGPLFGDNTLMSIKESLQNTVLNVTSPEGNALSAFGVTVSDNLDGTLDFNQSQLTSALNTNPSDVANLFGTLGLTGKGSVPGLESSLFNWVNPGDGTLTLIQQNEQTLIASLNVNIGTQQTLINQEMASYTSQFIAMDSAMSAMNSQVSSILNMLSSSSSSSSSSG